MCFIFQQLHNANHGRHVHANTVSKRKQMIQKLYKKSFNTQRQKLSTTEYFFSDGFMYDFLQKEQYTCTILYI